MAQSTFITDTNAGNNLAAGNVTDSSEYARILAEKIAEVDSEMNNTQNNSANQQETASSGNNENSMTAIETLRRIMPDGSLKIVTYEDGKIVEQMKIRTHQVMKPDYSLPPDPVGNLQMKPEQRLSLAALLMA
jgi:hypothetical protein